MKRNKHSLSHYHLTTFDMGELVPVANFEVLPGDSIRMSTSALIRVSPLMAPVMHPVTVRLHHWFVPHRLIWPSPTDTSSWEDFITGGPDGVFSGTYPTFNATELNASSLAPYFGVPASVNAGVTASQLPFRAYNKIWNENYRDEDLQAELNVVGNMSTQRVSWEKDYFTSARPWTQKGPGVSMPLGTSAPVIGNGGTLGLRDAGGTVRNMGHTTGSPNVSTTTTPSTNGNYTWSTNPLSSGLIADLTAATAAQVNDLRRAMALQRYQEARAQYGHRYVEYLRYLGVRSSDARMDRPEYLGGGKSTISFSEVLRTATTPEEAAPVGDMSGHGIAGVRSRSFVRFFEEHGTVLTLASVRPRSIYMNGIHRSWLRRTKEDYWQKELELIGQQAIRNAEVYAPSADPLGTFGYQDRYAEYRHLPSYVSGDFRTTLNDWHLARIFGSAPTLNAAFVSCDPGVRPFADQTSADKLWCMFSHSIQARRMVTKKTIGRIM